MQPLLLATASRALYAQQQKAKGKSKRSKGCAPFASLAFAKATLCFWLLLLLLGIKTCLLLAACTRKGKRSKGCILNEMKSKGCCCC